MSVHEKERKGGERRKIMDLLLWVFLGGLAGYLASVIMRTNREQGLVMDIVLGIVGGFLGGLLMNLLGQPGVNGFNLYSLFVALLGAVALIWIGRMVYR